MKKYFFLFSCTFLFANIAFTQTDTETRLIKNEGLSNSKVMEIVFHLTDISGPRLTNSPGFFRAANWAKDDAGLDALEKFAGVIDGTARKIEKALQPAKADTGDPVALKEAA